MVVTHRYSACLQSIGCGFESLLVPFSVVSPKAGPSSRFNFFNLGNKNAANSDGIDFDRCHFENFPSSTQSAFLLIDFQTPYFRTFYCFLIGAQTTSGNHCPCSPNTLSTMMGKTHKVIQQLRNDPRLFKEDWTIKP